MTRQPDHHTAANTAPGTVPTDEAGFNDGPYDLSMDHVPAGWIEAQLDSPLGQGDSTPINRGARFSVVPTGHDSPFIPNIAALGASFVGGTAWYFAEILSISRGPWIAVAVGVFIALAVRMTGVGEPPYRAMASVAAYLLTVLIVLMLVTRRDLTSIYGSAYGFDDYEQTLVRNRLQDAWHVSGYVVGGLLAAQIGYFRGKIRSS
ncbi:MAG: hypothetical protein ACR2QK_20175 [Acidimicrobiales bacterium]